MGEFGMSQPVARVEDARFLTGAGHFVDDETLPGQLHAVVLRSPHAHADLNAIDTAAAMAAPGVCTVLTGRHYAADGLGLVPHIGPPVKRRDGAPVIVPPFAPLAADRVRFVGDAVALVVAETAAQARDAAELIEFAYTPLETVVSGTAALEPDAPVLWPECPDNESFLYEVGDRAATDTAFAVAML